MGYKVCAEAKKRGVLLRPLGNVIVVMPPLGISKGDLDRLIEVISVSIQKATGVRF
jgi:adenosylmethionine-8-amino-7-oxononanoate aminotransferase